MSVKKLTVGRESTTVSSAAFPTQRDGFPWEISMIFHRSFELHAASKSLLCGKAGHSYNLPSFKSKINKLDFISLSS